MSLDERTQQHVQLVAEGKTDKEIAKVFEISHFAARNRLAALLREYSARHRNHLAYVGMKSGLIDPGLWLEHMPQFIADATLQPGEQRVAEHLRLGYAYQDMLHEFKLSPGTIQGAHRRIAKRLCVPNKGPVLVTAILIKDLFGWWETEDK